MLEAWSQIRPKERSDTIVATLSLFAFICSQALLATARDALFLASIPAINLPWVYIAGAVLALIVARGIAGRQASSGRRLSGWLLGCSAVTLGFWPLVATQGLWVLYALYIWSALAISVIVARFFVLLGDLFTVTQAKRLYAAIGVGSALGAIAGSGLAAVISLFLPAPWCPNDRASMIVRRLRERVSAGLGLALSLAVMRPAVARANPVNVETLRPTQGTDGWTGAWDFSVALRHGNVDKLQASSVGGVQYQNLHPASTGFGARPRPPQAPRFFKDRIILAAGIKWGNVSGARFLNSGFAHARYTRNLVPRVGLELIGQSQYNEFTLLKSRLVGGTGVRVDAIHRERFSLWGGTGYLLEYETNDIVPGDPHGAFLLNHRWNNYLVAQMFMLQGRLVLQNAVYAQPLWTKFSDVRVLEQFQLEGKLSESFRLGVNLEVAHDSRPPLTVTPTDITLSNYIRLQFG